MLLHGDGTNGAQNNTFTDSSTNNFTITRNGNTTQGTFSPYGDNWSNYFDGNGDYLTCSASVPATGAFTVEMWVYPQSSGGYQLLFSQYTSGNAGSLQILWDDTNDKFTVNIGFGAVLTSSSTYSTNAWYHLAIVRDGSNNMTMWVNGASAATTTNSTSILQTTTYIASRSALDGYFNGYISNLRVTNTAVYTATFTPSTSPLTAISGTSLLTCQSNRFIDNSTNAFTITRNGDVSVQRFSPFAPTAAYSAATIGGSGYFDGSGDYLTASAPNLSGVFTIEFWVYRGNTTAANQLVIAGKGDSQGNVGFEIYVGSTGTQLNFYQNDAVQINGGNVIRIGEWNHIAAVRNSSNLITMYVNGVSVGSFTSSVTYTGTNYAGSAGYAGGLDGVWTGYISGYRLVTSEVYTGNFTPPTAPPTAITNTQLLLNFTNAGIIDNAMMNDLETVGNAQISTSVKKYGTGSIYVDGTGDWLFARSSPDISLSGNFTIEGWVYQVNNGTSAVLLCIGDSDVTGGIAVYIDNQSAPTGPYLAVAYNSAIIIGTTAAAINTWHHIAVVRSGSTITLFLDGVSQGTVSASTTFTGNLRVGAVVFAGTTYPGNNYIDDLRITNGVARYTANFTPPTAAFSNN